MATRASGATSPPMEMAQFLYICAFSTRSALALYSTKDVVEVGAREVEFLLFVGVLGLDQLGVLILVMGVVGGVLGVEQRAEFLRPAVEMCIRDSCEIALAQPFSIEIPYGIGFQHRDVDRLAGLCLLYTSCSEAGNTMW